VAVPTGPAGQLDQCVERVRVAGLVATLALGVAEDLLDHRVQRGVDHRPRVGGAPGLQVPAALAVGETPQPPLLVQPAVGGIRVGVTRRLGPVGLFTQLHEVAGASRVQQRPLRRRVHSRGLGDGLGLGPGQVAAAQGCLGGRQPPQPLGGLQPVAGCAPRGARLAGQVVFRGAVAGPGPGSRLLHPRAEEGLGRGGVAFDGVERLPHLRGVAQGHVTRHETLQVGTGHLLHVLHMPEQQAYEHVYDASARGGVDQHLSWTFAASTTATSTTRSTPGPHDPDDLVQCQETLAPRVDGQDRSTKG
jgi:hypothetical protein